MTEIEGIFITEVTKKRRRGRVVEQLGYGAESRCKAGVRGSASP